MKKIMLIGSFFAAISFSGLAQAVVCPAPDTVVSTHVEEDSDGISSMIYCSPSSTECSWKGFDPFATEGHKVVSVNNGGKATEHNGLIYCDYKLDSGDQIRLSLLKK